MTSKTMNKFSPEVRAHPARMAPGHETECPSPRTAIMSIASKIGCTVQTLGERLKKARFDIGWFLASATSC